MDKFDDKDYFKNIKTAKQFPSLCFMMTGVPSHATEGK